MKKCVIANAALLLVVAICLTTAYAGTARAASQDTTAKQAGQMGKVVAIDTAKNELVVKDEKGTDKTLSVGPTTKITKDGKDIALTEVKTGDRVMYELEGTSEPAVAKSLLVMAAKSAKP